MNVELQKNKLYKHGRVKRIPTAVEILQVKTTTGKGLSTQWGVNRRGELPKREILRFI